MTTVALRCTVLVAGDDVYEDIFGAVGSLTDIAAERGLLPTRRIGLGGFVFRADRGDVPDVLVLYTAAGEQTLAQQLAIVDAVEAGMGVVAIHSSVVLDPDAPLARLIGVRFATHGPHPHESTFTVRPDPDHPAVAGVASFEIRHEHYEVEVIADDLEVLATREPSGQPVMTSRTHGRGRVSFIQLGHDMRAWGEPGVRALVGRGIDWVAAGVPAAGRPA